MFKIEELYQDIPGTEQGVKNVTNEEFIKICNKALTAKKRKLLPLPVVTEIVANKTYDAIAYLFNEETKPPKVLTKLYFKQNIEEEDLEEFCKNFNGLMNELDFEVKKYLALISKRGIMKQVPYNSILKTLRNAVNYNSNFNEFLNVLGELNVFVFNIRKETLLNKHLDSFIEKVVHVATRAVGTRIIVRSVPDIKKAYDSIKRDAGVTEKTASEE